MSLRYILLAALLIAGISHIKADEPDSSAVIINEIESSEKIDVIMPEGLSQRLMQSTFVATQDSVKTYGEAKNQVGYRVQVYDNNASSAKSGADACKTKIEKRFPELTAYVRFYAPYWRVKVGDFTSRSEAEVFMETIREEFPETVSQLRVVRDCINLHK